MRGGEFVRRTATTPFRPVHRCQPPMPTIFRRWGNGSEWLCKCGTGWRWDGQNDGWYHAEPAHLSPQACSRCNPLECVCHCHRPAPTDPKGAERAAAQVLRDAAAYPDECYGSAGYRRALSRHPGRQGEGEEHD